MSAPAPSMYSPAAKAMAEAMGLKLGRANQDVFADTVLALAKQNDRVTVVTSDSRGSGKLGPFGQALPHQLVEVGIAEQNLVGVAAGLASCGRVVFGVSPACFLTARSLEQVKNDVCYSDNPVKLVGISAGVSYGALGTTHHSLHDLAALRAVNNIDLIVPADNAETEAAVRWAATSGRPAYLRFGKVPTFTLGRVGLAFEFGKASVVLDEGRDVAFLATGETVAHATLAAGLLARDHGVRCRVLSLHTVKPLDEQAVIAAARECKALVTVEEHSTHGGLGDAVAATLMRAGVAVPFRAVGLPDEYTVTGSQADIFRHYGITMEGLAATALHTPNGKDRAGPM